MVLKGRLQLDANQRYFRVKAFQIGNVPQLRCLGGAKGAGIEAMFAGITVAFLATALPFNLCLVCSHVLRSLTSGIWFVRVAHEFQIEISMNSSFQQGENVTSSPRDWRHLEISRDTVEIGWRDWRLEIGDWRLEAAGCLPFAPTASGLAKTRGRSVHLIPKCN